MTTLGAFPSRFVSFFLFLIIIIIVSFFSVLYFFFSSFYHFFLMMFCSLSQSFQLFLIFSVNINTCIGFASGVLTLSHAPH